MSWQTGCSGGSEPSSSSVDSVPSNNSLNGSSGFMPSRNTAPTPFPTKWKDVISKVKEMRRLYSNLFVKTPTSVKFRQISNDRLRIYFLLCPAQGREATLFYSDLNLNMVGYILGLVITVGIRFSSILFCLFHIFNGIISC